jgi:WS/DGAT/MGAT family acyltransferase
MGMAERFDQHMSDADALMWNIEKDPQLRSTIVSLAVLDSAPDWDRVTFKIDRATRVIERMRQRVVVPPFRVGPPRWSTDPWFNLDFHLRRVRAPEPATLRSVLDLAEPLAMAGFDRARPLWEFTLVEGLEDGRAALIQKIHHSVTDGVGGMALAMNLYDLEREPASAEAMPAAPESESLSAMSLLAESIAHSQRRVAGSSRRLLRASARGVLNPVGATTSTINLVRSLAKALAPVNEPMSRVMVGRGLSYRFDTLDVGLDELKRAAKSVGGTLNDAFVGGVTGGLRIYHERHGAPADELRMTMPINLRDANAESAGGNQFAPARFPVPVGAIPDPAQRLARVRELVAAWRDEPVLGATEAVAGVLNRLPTRVTTQLFGSMLKHVDFVTSNVPGAPIPIFMGGAEVIANYAFGPLSGAAANITLLSHTGTCCIGINTDAAAVRDPDVLVDSLQQGFDEVLALGNA